MTTVPNVLLSLDAWLIHGEKTTQHANSKKRK